MVIPFAPQRRNVVYRSAMMRAFVLIASLAAAAPAYAAPCIAASTGCTEWVALGGGPARSRVYRTYPRDTKNEQITRALGMVHGAGRDADHYFTTALAATFLATFLIPMFYVVVADKLRRKPKSAPPAAVPPAVLPALESGGKQP